MTQGDLICFQRKSGGDQLPGCEGTPNAGTDFCIRPEFTPEPTRKPTRRPTPRPTRKPTRTREFCDVICSPNDIILLVSC
jgi:hypothetical protein